MMGTLGSARTKIRFFPPSGLKVAIVGAAHGAPRRAAVFGTDRPQIGHAPQGAASGPLGRFGTIPGSQNIYTTSSARCDVQIQRVLHEDRGLISRKSGLLWSGRSPVPSPVVI